MIFLTVGTQFPFDRLVKTIDDAFDNGLIDEKIFAQIGESSYRPRNFESVTSLEKRRYEKYFKEASYIISHAGIGTITMTLDNHKPMLVMPRLRKYDEVVNDHQKAIAGEFEKHGHILVAYSIEELPEKLRELKNFVPKPRKNQVKAVTDRITKFLDELQQAKY